MRNSWFLILGLYDETQRAATLSDVPPGLLTPCGITLN